MRATIYLPFLPLLLATACGGETQQQSTSTSSSASSSGATSSSSSSSSSSTSSSSSSSGMGGAGGGSGLPAGIYAMDGTDPKLPDTDLAPIASIVGNAKVTSFGETIHYSNGYAEARARLIRYMIEKQGFRALAFEGMWAPAEATAAWLEDDKGTLKDAMNGLSFSVWWSQAQADLLTWVHDFNKAHPNDKVRFFGFDMQQPTYDGKAIRDFLAANAPGTQSLQDGTRSCVGAKLDTIQAEYADAGETSLLTLMTQEPMAQHQACEDAVAGAKTYVDTNEAALTASVGAEAVRRLRMSLTGLAASDVEYYDYSIDPKTSYEARDDVMAKFFLELWKVRAPGARAVIWAHNDHIIENMLDETAPFKWHSFGSSIDEALGADYAPIGLTALHVDYNWNNQGAMSLPAPGKGTVEEALSTLGKSPLIVDLDFANSKTPFLDPAKLYGFGSVAEDQRMHPRHHFRGLVYLDKSPAIQFWMP